MTQHYQQQPTTTPTPAILFPPEIAPQSARFPGSREERRRKCAWCWYERQVQASQDAPTPYPEEWSSTICEEHEAAMLAEVEPARRRRDARRAARRSHVFTLTFPGGEVALLTVYGAESQQQAHAAAERAFQCSFELAEGDQTREGELAAHFRLTVAQGQGEPRP